MIKIREVVKHGLMLSRKQKQVFKQVGSVCWDLWR